MAAYMVIRTPRPKYRNAYNIRIIFVEAKNKAGALREAAKNADFAEESPYHEYGKPTVKSLDFNKQYYL